MPDWSTSEWAGVLSAFWAAAAATASWFVIATDRKRQREALRPHVAAGFAVPPNRISDIVNGKRSITADTALRLGKYFGVSPEVWLGLQADYDLRISEHTSQ